MKNNRIGFSFRKRVYLSFIIMILPVILLLVLLLEWALIPFIHSSIWKELENSALGISKSIELAAEISIKNHLKGIAVRNLESVRNYWDFYERGLLSRIEMEEALEEILLSQMVGDSGYIYCIDSAGTVLIHPEEGVAGTTVFQYDFVQQQMEQKEGFIEYEWKNPDDPAARLKALYMVYFEPLDWIISVSSYREEFNDLVQLEDLRDLTLSLNFGQSGYSYLSHLDGRVLIHPLYDPGADPIKDTSNSQDFFDVVQKKDFGRLEYSWQNPGDTKSRDKLAVFKHIRDFDWVIVSSAYRDDVFEPVRVIRLISYGAVFLLLAGTILTALFLSRRVSEPLESIVGQLENNTQKGVINPVTVISRDEWAILGKGINRFIKTIEEKNGIIQKERQNYLDLFEASPDGVFILEELKFVDCNPKTLELFEMTREELLQANVLELSPEKQPDNKPSESAAYEKLDGLEIREIVRFEWKHLNAKGKPFDAEVQLKPFGFSENGKPLYVAFLRDITEKKKADRALRNEMEFSRTLIDASPAYILLTDLDFRVQNINPSFLKIMGLSGEEIQGRNILDILKPDQAGIKMESTLNQIKDSASKEEGITRTDSILLRTMLNQERVIQWSTTWIPGENKGEESILIVGMDLSEEKKLQEQLYHTQKLEAIGRLAGGVAHEFNNLLMGVVGTADWIQSEMSHSDPHLPALQQIIDTGEKAAQLSSKLLSFSRKMKNKTVTINSREWIENVVNIFTAGLDVKNRFQCDLEKEPLLIRGDTSMLQNMLMSILINAQEAMPDEGGLITLSSRKKVLDNLYCSQSSFSLTPGTYIELRIEDNGIGMDEKILKNIFDPFFSTKEEGLRSGLGLSSAFGIIKDHKGEILVESEPGSGTLFIMRFPVSSVNNH